MTNKVDVLAVLDETFECCAQVGMRDYRHPTARAAVAELIKAAQRMESAVGGGARCEARAMLRSALAKIGA